MSDPRVLLYKYPETHIARLTLNQPERWTASAILRLVSGQPYTPDVPSGATGSLESNSGRKPNGVVLDLRGERTIGGPLNLRLFGRAFNVFDTRSFNGFVFTDTGSPDYTRQPSTRESVLADPTRFYAPRRLEVGVSASGLLGGGGS